MTGSPIDLALVTASTISECQQWNLHIYCTGIEKTIGANASKVRCWCFLLGGGADDM